MDVSKKTVVLTLGFGKYKGITPTEVVETVRGYLEWLRDKAENIFGELKNEITSLLIK